MPATSVVTLMSGLAITPQAVLDPARADLLIVPGGGYGLPAGSPGVPAEIARGRTPSALADIRRGELTIAAVCTGVMLLSAAGITRNRACTTHRRVRADLEGGILVDARVVDDGDLVTAGGVTSGLDLALWLVERELGAELAVSVEALLEYERRGTVWRRR
ncbi:DJ-1/PfpI family protein [Nocardia puris]|uniref:DJ-1/PfpI family protein n=1 Tax=Nocardia puris TaxID=208602 RepID=A0A366DXL8_9NOCA|nr:DJ-1/PfpI family protein [Nocardia puris]MBF6210511.1 DJ-1/PfpI family protein [Nocardia puris]MBF6369236.1 DJ-1/PfpI family protein [Nocardia puris]MBF6457771.1 DJ-1/PfpI family protein [Nocardia puris]RBO93938.1 DJ-1/PfpI family protein [Nocardia puris]